MPNKYAIHDSTQLYFVTYATVNWIDVFTRNCYSDIVVDSLNFCVEHKALEIYSWCIMSNHVHMIISSETANLSAILREHKSFTAKKIIKLITTHPKESRKEWMLKMFKEAGANNSRNRHVQFWQQDNHPVELTTNEMIEQRLNYIHNNPVRAHIVANAEDYIYSSARDYCGEKGLVKLCMMD